MAKISSPGHKLGQMIGNFFEDIFAEDLTALCNKHGFYCDRKGSRPNVRGRRRRVVWTDKDGNEHGLDYVIERGGSCDKCGVPAAFIELAWRRYTKHSRNKTGELEGALLPLRDSYQTCCFLGAIVAGEYTEGGKKQLTSHGITVLHIPFNVLVSVFKEKGIDLTYAEDAPAEHKRDIISKWESLSESDIKALKDRFRSVIANEYSTFKKELKKSLIRTIEAVNILPLYGAQMGFPSISEAVKALAEFDDVSTESLEFVKFEVQIRYTNGDRVQGTFHDKHDAIHFLEMFS